MPGPTPVRLFTFNRLPAATAVTLARGCLDVPRWYETLVGARPYGDYETLLEVARDAAYPLTAPELEAAVADHLHRRRAADAAPRDHGRDSPSAPRGRGSEWDDLSTTYASRFGRPFIVRAAGRSAAEITGLLAARLANSLEAEDAVVGTQLRQICLLALSRRVSE